MSQVQVTYDEHRNWGRLGHKQDFRPYEEVELFGPTGSHRLWCLVDTGADDLQVDESVAKIIGYDLQVNGHIEQVETASGGTTQVTVITDLDVGIEGKIFKVDCLFGSNSTPILGRTAILAALEIGFDVNGWLLKP